MDWIKLAIPLIAVAVWILSNLASQQKEIRRPPRVPLPPPRPRDPLDPLPTATTQPAAVDQYRDALERQREKKTALPKPAPKVRSRRLDPLPKPPRVPPVPVPPPPPVRAPQPTPPALEPTPSLAPSPPASQKPPATREATATSAAPPFKRVLQLLKTRDSLATAFLLREILDRPVAKRPRRRA
jgi:hypothetical protein